MAKKKKSMMGWIIGILIILVLFTTTLSVQEFSVTDLKRDTVYTPVFTNTECTVIDFDNTETYDWNSRQDSNGWITEFCGRNNHRVYTNRCELELIRENQGGFTSSARITEFYVCPIGTTFGERETKCSKKSGVFGTFSFTSTQFVLARARDNLGFGEVEEDEITIKKVANWYGLKTIDSNNFLSKEVTCDVSRITDKGFTFLKEEMQKKAPSGILPFNQVMNYISAQRPTVSKNVISFEGKQVWTIGNKEACPIKEDINGIRFVDISECFNAPELICNPALPYCSDDGTEITNIDASDKDCNELYGSFLNQYTPISTDSSLVCKSSCEDGKLKYHSCKVIPTCETGTLNADYVCVSANVDEGDGVGGTDLFYVYLGMSVLGVLLLIFIIKMAIDKKKVR